MNYFSREENGLTKCLLCSHYCLLKNEKRGICGVNKAKDGKIECLVYGYIDALNIDPIEKKPLYHFLPNTNSLSLGTVACNFKCNFCQNHSLSQKKLPLKENFFYPEDIVKIALKYNTKSISFTYNEPTIFYPFAKDVALEAKKYGIKSIFVTNGFQSKEVIEDFKGTIDALNVDLKSFNPSFYKSIGGDLNIVLENLKLLRSLNLHLEITTLVIPTKNDSFDELRKIASFIKNELSPDTPWHISAFYPNFKLLNLNATEESKILQIVNMAKKEGLVHVYGGNIGEENPTICPNCKEVLIQRRYFKVIKNALKDGKCFKCGKSIKGVFT